jgi:molybdenum cofactor cytidylyltransferase
VENPRGLPLMPPLTILIPAAGNAVRMRGGDKLLELAHGQPMLRHQAMLALTLSNHVLITLRDPDPAREAALHGLNVTQIPVPDASSGMSASLRRAAHITTALMILPGDMPDLTTDDLAQMAAAHAANPDRILRGASGATPGHPVILPAALVPDLAHLTGDEGARSLIGRHGAGLIQLPGQNAITDLDTPEAWAAWRNRPTA